MVESCYIHEEYIELEKNKTLSEMKSQPKQRSSVGSSAYGGYRFFGIHKRKNSCWWESKCNKYCSKQYLLFQEITKCHCCFTGKRPLIREERTSTFSVLNSISRTTNAAFNLLHVAWWLQAHISSSRTTDFLCFIRRVSIYCNHSTAPCPGLEMTHLTALIIIQHTNTWTAIPHIIKGVYYSRHTLQVISGMKEDLILHNHKETIHHQVVLQL